MGEGSIMVFTPEILKTLLTLPKGFFLYYDPLTEIATFSYYYNNTSDNKLWYIYDKVKWQTAEDVIATANHFLILCLESL